VPGKKYDYKVKAWNSGGYSSDSPEDEGWAGLAAPALISASQGLYSSWVRISWDPVTGANGFDVYRATAQTGVYTKIGQCTVLTAPYYYDSTATTGFGYYYKAMAYRTNSLNGETVYSAYSTFAYGWR